VSVLNDVAAFLSAQGLGTVGVDIFIGFLPATPTPCCAVFEYGGSAPSGGFGTYGTVYEKPAVQVVFRGSPEDYLGPRTKAQTAFRALHAVAPGALPGVTPSTPNYLLITPNQQPFIMERDANRCVKIACNYSCEKEP